MITIMKSSSTGFSSCQEFHGTQHALGLDNPGCIQCTKILNKLGTISSHNCETTSAFRVSDNYAVYSTVWEGIGTPGNQGQVGGFLSTEIVQPAIEIYSSEGK